MIELMIGTILAAGCLIWLSTKTQNGGFQKMFVVLGLLLIAVAFLQGSVLLPEQKLANITTNFTYDNVTLNTSQEWEWQLNQTVQTYNYEDVDKAQDIKNGNMALFIIFCMVTFIAIVWVFVDLLGITVDELGRIVRKKPPTGRG